jgi:hypothetical protein
MLEECRVICPSFTASDRARLEAGQYMHPYAASLEKYFRPYPPSTCAQAQQVIAAQTGVRRTLHQVRAWTFHCCFDRPGDRTSTVSEPGG